MHSNDKYKIKSLLDDMYNCIVSGNTRSTSKDIMGRYKDIEEHYHDILLEELDTYMNDEVDMHSDVNMKEGDPA